MVGRNCPVRTAVRFQYATAQCFCGDTFPLSAQAQVSSITKYKCYMPMRDGMMRELYWIQNGVERRSGEGYRLLEY